MLLTGAAQCGLYVDTAKCWLAASPDGLVGGEAVVEVKCPLACEATRLDWLAHHDNTFCLQPDLVTGTIRQCITYCRRYLTLFSGGLRLKRSHNYYYQIQGQMHITRR